MFVGGRVDERGALVCVGFGGGLAELGSTVAGLRDGACVIGFGAGAGAAVGSGAGAAAGVVVGEGMVTGAVGITAAVKSTGCRATTATADTAMASANPARVDSAATLAARLCECCAREAPRSMDSVYAGVTPTATRGTVLTVNPQQSPNTLAVHRVDGGQL